MEPPATRTRIERITADDGGLFDAYLALPPTPPTGGGEVRGPGILLVQEIFGITDYIRARASTLAQMGYVVMAPDVFWRLEPNVEFGHSQGDLQKALALVGRFDGPQGLRDLTRALAHLRALPETGEKTGVLGFCFGGTMAYLMACHTDVDCAVSYYGSRIGSMLDQGEQITCPLLFQYARNDNFITADEIAAVGAFAAQKPHIEQRLYDAGHAFDNTNHPMFANAEASRAAWEATSDFLATHLPVS